MCTAGDVLLDNLVFKKEIFDSLGLPFTLAEGNHIVRGKECDFRDGPANSEYREDTR